MRVGGESYRTFDPPPLPPDPPLELGGLYGLVDRATIALARLDGVAGILPDPRLLMYFYNLKEALLSSQIEGTQSSLSDLLLREGEVGNYEESDDDREVSNYVAAMSHGLKRLNDGFPLSLRLIKEIHAILLRDGRGADKQPGEFRTSQNWVGGTRPGNATFVPPPHGDILRCLGDLEQFIHNDNVQLPLLVKAGLVHVQFESIHPFLDGNGRMGRLLITFMLCNAGVMKQPMLYLSLYLKTHRRTYYESLQQVRETDNWLVWLDFFLNGVAETAEQATEASERIKDLFDVDRQEISDLGRGAAVALQVHEQFQKTPISSIGTIARKLDISIPTATKYINALADRNIVVEMHSKARGKRFAYRTYFNILSEGTEPIDA